MWSRYKSDFSFQQLHKSSETNHDVFRSSVEPTLQLYVAGYNVCLIVAGETGSGKTHTVAGESTVNPGIVPLAIQHLFAKFTEGMLLMGSKQLINCT